jgi:hypothetical protein
MRAEYKRTLWHIVYYIPAENIAISNYYDLFSQRQIILNLHYDSTTIICVTMNPSKTRWSSYKPHSLTFKTLNLDQRAYLCVFPTIPQIKMNIYVEKFN